MRGSVRQFIIVFLLCLGLVVPVASFPVQTDTYLVHGRSIAQLETAVAQVDGLVTAAWPFTEAVKAELSPHAAAQLVAQGLLVHPDHQVVSSKKDKVEQGSIHSLYPAQVTQATQLQAQGINGNGIGIAVIDSGLPSSHNANKWERLDDQTLRYKHPQTNLVYVDLVSTTPVYDSSDPYGHGTHIISTIADDRPGNSGTVGIAPKAGLVVVRALDQDGAAPYSRVIEGIEWVTANKDTYNIRVLNLSLQATVNGPYWYDALNQAVMAAWDAGIVVVVAAGNNGPSPVSIMAPGNVPYVITVGALMPGAYTSDGVDTLARYSSAGPTESKFVKPDLLVPASRTLAPLPYNSELSAHAGLASESAQMRLGKFKTHDPLGYYYLSGTSMAAAEVSGLTALLLQTNPALTNNQVKHRLMSTAELATNTQGNAAYSIFQQGAGRVNILAAVQSTSLETENQGLNLALDRDHENGTHYMGQAEYDPTTNMFSYPIDVGGSNYSSWAGNYSSWAGNYSSWAGNYSSWAGNYSSWAGNYSSWAGNYSSWAGNYSSWAGNYSSWAGNYSSWAGDVFPR